MYLNITKKGLTLLEDIDKLNGGEHMQFINKISEEDAKKFSAALDKLRE